MIAILKTEVDMDKLAELDADMLKPVPVNLSDVVKNDTVKKRCV